MIQTVESGFLEGRVAGMCCFPGHPSLQPHSCLPRDVLTMEVCRGWWDRAAAQQHSFAGWVPGAPFHKSWGIFSPLSERHKGIVNKWSAGPKRKGRVSGACYQNLHVNKWLKKPVRKCPCVIICAISRITEHGFVFEPLKMRELLLFIALLNWELGTWASY